MPIFGNKERFAMEVGEFCPDNPPLRRVDLWAAGRWLTCDDNHAFVPQFCFDVRHTLRWLRSYDLDPPFPGVSLAETHRRLIDAADATRERFALLRWGPTTDNLLCNVFRVDDQIAVTFEFWRETHPVPEELGIVFVAELPEEEFVRVLEQTLAKIESEWKPPADDDEG